MVVCLLITKEKYTEGRLPESKQVLTHFKNNSSSALGSSLRACMCDLCVALNEGVGEADQRLGYYARIDKNDVNMCLM